MANCGRYIERQPTIAMAGKSMFDQTNTAGGLMKPPAEDSPSDIVAKHLRKTNPVAGTRTYKFSDPAYLPSSAFGCVTQGNDVNVHTLMAPAQKSSFMEKLDSVKFPANRAPLGRGRNPKVRDHIDPHVDLNSTVFGKVVTSDATVAQCVCPTVTEEEEIAQATAKPMYIRSHHSWDTGVQKERNYMAPFNDRDRFGKPSPNSKEGKLVKQSLRWVNDARAEKVTPLVNVADRDYKDTNRAGLGTSAEPLKYTRHPDTMDMNYTYGSQPTKSVETVKTLFGAQAELAETRGDMNDADVVDVKTAAPFALQTQTLSYNYLPFKQELENLDAKVHENMSGMLPREHVLQLMAKHEVPVGEEALPDHAEINYRNLLAVLDEGIISVRADKGEQSIYGTAVVNTKHFDATPFAGHPSMRLDVTRPTLKHLMDKRNHGDQGGVNTIMNPSPMTQRGLNESEAVHTPRSKDVIKGIFDAAGLEATHSFDAVWDFAAANWGDVTVASFQAALDQV